MPEAAEGGSQDSRGELEQDSQPAHDETLSDTQEAERESSTEATDVSAEPLIGLGYDVTWNGLIASIADQRELSCIDETIDDEDLPDDFLDGAVMDETRYTAAWPIWYQEILTIDVGDNHWPHQVWRCLEPDTAAALYVTIRLEELARIEGIAVAESDAACTMRLPADADLAAAISETLGTESSFDDDEDGLAFLVELDNQVVDPTLLSCLSAATGPDEAVTAASGDQLFDGPYVELQLISDPLGYFEIQIPTNYTASADDEFTFLGASDDDGNFGIYYFDLAEIGLSEASLHEYAAVSEAEVTDSLGASAVENSAVLETELGIPVHLFEYTDGEWIAIGVTFLIDGTLAAQTVYRFPYDLSEPARELAYHSFDTLAMATIAQEVGLQVEPQTTWRELHDTFMSHEQDCILEKIGDSEALSEFLTLSPLGDDPRTGYVFECLEPSRAGTLFANLVVAGARVPMDEALLDCLRGAFADADAARLVAADLLGELDAQLGERLEEFMASTSACLQDPEVAVARVIRDSLHGDMSEEEIDCVIAAAIQEAHSRNIDLASALQALETGGEAADQFAVVYFTALEKC